MPKGGGSSSLPLAPAPAPARRPRPHLTKYTSILPAVLPDCLRLVTFCQPPGTALGPPAARFLASPLSAAAPVPPPLGPTSPRLPPGRLHGEGDAAVEPCSERGAPGHGGPRPAPPPRLRGQARPPARPRPTGATCRYHHRTRPRSAPPLPTPTRRPPPPPSRAPPLRDASPPFPRPVLRKRSPAPLAGAPCCCGGGPPVPQAHARCPWRPRGGCKQAGGAAEAGRAVGL